jgi:hypothetical protein
MLIANDRVLTAAHCFCTWDYVGSNTCDPAATVRLRDDPATPGINRPTIVGIATTHPSYNPTWTDREIEHDIAVVRLATAAPAYARPFRVAGSRIPSGSTVKIVGFGHTGSGCGGPLGTLNSDILTISQYVDENRIIQFNDQVTCGGDSGGPVLSLDGEVIHGVHSGNWATISHGVVSKSIATYAYHAWIKEHTCATDLWNRCSSKGPLCQCAAGLGDCDADSDCRAGLLCRENVGAVFGLPPSADVCAAPGPVEGTCSCSEGVSGNRCVAAHGGCSAGFTARCNPTRSTASTECGGCSCL